MKRSDGAMTTLRPSKSFMNSLVNMALGKTQSYTAEVMPYIKCDI